MQKTRRLQGKTDYKKRLKLLRGEKPRIVIRKTNRYVTIQYIISEEARDKVLLAVSSKILTKYGWKEKDKNSLKSIPAAYLTGYLFGIKMKDRELDEKAIVDLGMYRPIINSRIFSAVKGVVDSGVKITFNGKINEERINGSHIKREINLNEIKKKIEKEI